MGRTVPTFNTSLMAEEESWRPFRRALRKHEREAFDRLFTWARCHAASGTAAARPVPFDAMLMGMLVGLQMDVQRLRKQVGDLEEEMRRLRGEA